MWGDASKAPPKWELNKEASFQNGHPQSPLSPFFAICLLIYLVFRARFTLAFLASLGHVPAIVGPTVPWFFGPLVLGPLVSQFSSPPPAPLQFLAGPEVDRFMVAQCRCRIYVRMSWLLRWGNSNEAPNERQMVMGIAAVPICDMHSPEEMLYAIFACTFPQFLALGVVLRVADLLSGGDTL